MKMKPYTLLGIILIAVAVAIFTYQGITFTTREKVVDLGAIHMTADKTRKISLPPIAGVLALVGGLALLVAGSKRA